MKKKKLTTFFVVAFLIFFLTYTAFAGFGIIYGDLENKIFKGADDIRWGIDIRGGVDVTFAPANGVDATKEQMESVESVIQQRLVSSKITDYELYTDYDKDKVIVRFPWKEGEINYDPQQAIKELGETAVLTFREGYNVDEDGLPTGTTKDKIILNGNDIVNAYADVQQSSMGSQQTVVVLKLTDDGAAKFSEATGRLINQEISIWMDDTNISHPTVNTQITNGDAIIEGVTTDEAKSLASKIRAGALPFGLTTENFNTISPSLGVGAKDAMILSGAIAFGLVCLFMLLYYRLPGVVACLALLGQVAGSVAAVSGYFGFLPSFTLTLPGIAGIILSIGMGVDANVITAERIKEEIRAGKSIDSGVAQGYEKGFSAIFDGNITVIIVAVILMGAFGPPDSFCAVLLRPLFQFFPTAAAGAIYSFGYTLLIGVVFNFVMGVTASRLMLKSLTSVKFLRKNWLYGGKRI